MAEIETTVDEIMSSPPRSIDADATIASAARVLTERGIGSLIVGEDRIEGIITESDVVAGVVEEHDLATMSVRELMSSPVVTARPTDTVRRAGELMGNNRVKKLPVTEEGRPVGIVTTTDLAHFVPRQRVQMATRRESEIEEGEFE
jgi:signal-transduction protein with cAMP-binding, CBS, and nucleotidyltransferase domain